MWTRWTSCAVIAVALAGALASPGCGVHPYYGEEFGERAVDLDVYKSVQQRVGHGDGRRVAVAAAVSGGSQRSAYFGLGVLMGLERIHRSEAAWPNGLSEIDYFSTVSGGSIAVGAYLSSLHDHIYFGGDRPHAGSPKDYRLARALGWPGSDRAASPGDLDDQRCDPNLLGRLERGYAQLTIEGAFSLATLGVLDAGDFLESALDSRALGRDWRRSKLAARSDPRGAALTLGDVFIRRGRPQPVRLPYWIPNAMVFENGSIFPFTPDILEHYRVRGYVHHMAHHRYDPDRHGYDEFIDRVPLSVGMTASGKCPILIPATVLTSSYDRNHPHLRLVDGGPADNLGVLTALRLLRDEKHPDVRRKVLIAVDAYNGPLRPFSAGRSKPSALSSMIQTMTAPLDSWRGRSQEIVRALAASAEFGGDIQPVFLRFEDLLGLEDFLPLCRHGLSDECAAYWNERNVTPYQACREISTWSTPSAEQRDLLLAAGRYVASRKETEIRRALGW